MAAEDHDEGGVAESKREDTPTIELEPVLDAVFHESRIIEQKCKRSAASHFKAAAFWSNIQLLFGGLAAILSAIAGASALAELDRRNIVAGSLALAVTTLTAVTTFLNPSEQANAHLRAGNAYLALQNRARMFRRVELPAHPKSHTLSRPLLRLAEQLNELNRTSPQVSRWLYERARKQTEEDRQKRPRADPSVGRPLTPRPAGPGSS